MTKGTHRCHNEFRIAGFRPQIFALAAGVCGRILFFVSSGEFLHAAARIWFQFVERVIRNHIDERLLTGRTHGRGPLNLVVVSNRVSRGKPNEPMTGGLAAALLPIVEKSGAIWVGSSGRVRDGNLREPFAEIEALGTGALAMLDLPAALRRLL